MSKKAGGTQPASTDQSSLIRENMKCPVCLEVLLPPIYQCEAGHNICSSCIENIHVCPLCKSDYGDTRNYFAENLVNSMTFPCKYEEYGCTAVCLGSKLKDHQDSCEFQPYQCPELACKELFGIQQLKNHMDKRGFIANEGASHIATIEIQDEHFDNRVEYNPWRISAFGKEFYTLCVRTKDKNWFFWSWMLGEKREAKDYSYEMVVFTEDNQVAFRGHVQSLRTSPDDVMKAGNCLVLTDSLVKAMRKDKNINCSVRFIQGKIWDVKKPKNITPTASLASKKVATTANLTETPKKGKSSLVRSATGFKPNTPMTSPYLPSKKLKNSTTGKVVQKSVVPGLKPILVKSASAQARPETAKSASPQVPPSQKCQISDEENKLLTKLKDLLKCPGCGQTISPPIHQCVIGHNVCANCRADLDDCPLCRAPFGVSRNFYAEELLYRTTQRCRYSSTGCQVCLPTAQIRLHELTCEFAPFECPFHACRKTLDPRDLMSHLQSHNIPLVENELITSIAVPKKSPGTKKMCSIPSIIMVDGFPFYPLIVKDRCNLWAVWLTSKEHANYRYEFILKKQSKVLSYQGPVLSLRADQSEVISNGLALITTDKVVKGFKTNNQLEISIKICKNLPYSYRTSTFSINLDIDFEKLKSSQPKTKLFANKCVSVSPTINPRYLRSEDFAGREGWNDSDASSRTSLSLSADDERSINSYKKGKESLDQRESSEELPAEEILTISEEAIRLATPSDFRDEVTIEIGNVTLDSNNSQTTKPFTCTMKKLKAEFETTLPKSSSSTSSIGSDFNRKHKILQKPEAVVSSPIIPSLAHAENVRINAFKRKKYLDKLQKLLVTRSSAILKKCIESDQKFHSNPATAPEEIIGACETCDIEPEFEANADRRSSRTDSIRDFDSLLWSTPEKMKVGNFSNTSIKSDKSNPKQKKLTKKSNKSSTKSQKNSDTNVVKSNHSLQGKISRSSYFGAPLCEAIACLDISVEEEGDGFSDVLCAEESKNWKNSNYSSDLPSEAEEDEEIVGTAKAASQTRPKTRVKFADQFPVLNASQTHGFMFQETVDEIPKPKKSALKTSAQTEMVIPLKSTMSNQNPSFKSPRGSGSNDGHVEIAVGKKISTYSQVERVSSSVKGLELAKSGSTTNQSTVSDKSASQKKNESVDLIDLSERDTKWGISSASRFDTVMFETDPKSMADLLSGSEESSGLVDENTNKSAFVSEYDLLRQASLQESVPENEIVRSSKGDALIHLVPAGRSVSIMSMGNIKPSSRPRCRSATSNIAEDMEETPLPILMQDGQTQTIDEVQTACQVGSSLLKISTSGTGNPEQSQSQIKGTSDDPNLFGQGYETMANGISSTLNTVKSIFSGIGSNDTNEEDDSEEENEDDLDTYVENLGEDLDVQCITTEYDYDSTEY